MKKLTEVDKLKYWIDAEFSVIHVMLAMIMLKLTDGWLATLLLGLYIFLQVFYMVTRVAYVASQDRDYLKIPKK